MYLPKLKSIKTKQIKSIIEWGGLSRKALVKDNQLTSSTNLSTKHFPLLSPRPSRATSYTLTNGWALSSGAQLYWVDELTFTSPTNDITFGTTTITSASSRFSGISVGDTLTITGCTVNAANNQSAIVTTATAGTITCSASTFTTTNGTPAGRETAAITFTGCSFKYNNVTKGAVTASAKSMVDFNGKVYIMPDAKSYDYGTGTFAAWGTGTYPTAGAVPAMDYMAVLNNRIWGVKTDSFYCCKLGDASNWTTFSTPSEATDAFSVDTGTQGNFTGLATYRGSIIAFKTDLMLKLFGDIPANFQYVRVTDIGCLSNKSIAEVNNVLFFLGRKGYYAYAGGLPELISDDMEETYSSAVGGSDGRKYYTSHYDGSTYKLYVYDTLKNIWLQEDTLQVDDFTYFGGYLYGLSSTNIIYKFNSGTETVTYTAITKEYTEEISNKKGHSQLNFRVDLESGSTLTIWKRVDNGSWVSVKTYSTADLSSFIVPILIDRADHFQLKIVGVGEGKVYAVERIFHIGSDV